MTTSELTLSARRFIDTLKGLGVTHVVWLPDSEAGFLYQTARDDPDVTLVPVAREGEIIPICLGLQIGGKVPVALMQSTGFYEQGDSLRGLALELQMPLLLLIGYRGYQRDRKMTDSAATFLEPILDAWGVPHYVIETDRDLPIVERAFREAQQRPGPVAVLIGAEYH